MGIVTWHFGDLAFLPSRGGVATAGKQWRADFSEGEGGERGRMGLSRCSALSAR